MGSGEIAPTMVATHRRELGDGKRVTILDTPYGFQENADLLTEKIAQFFEVSLQVEVEPVRLRHQRISDRERLEAVNAIHRAEYLFAGPGSPTYALDVWRAAGIDTALREALASGATVVLASAAALTAGTFTIPVYEIYKVGSDPYWEEGIDLTGQFGLPMVVVPHWDNREGGNHDTSRCYIGSRRLARMERELADGVVGVDEHTAAAFDFAGRRMLVSGKGGVTLRGSDELRVEAGESIDLDAVAAALGGRASASAGAQVLPTPPEALPGFRAALEAADIGRAVDILLATGTFGTETSRMVAELGRVARRGAADPRGRIAGFVELILGLRHEARTREDFATADRLRVALAEHGVEVRDTVAGPEWNLTESD